MMRTFKKANYKLTEAVVNPRYKKIPLNAQIFCLKSDNFHFKNCTKLEKLRFHSIFLNL